MVHYIFAKATYRKWWGVDMIKAWLLDTKDPFLARRLQFMNAQSLFGFTQQFPKYFLVMPGQKAQVIGDAICPHCNKLATAHSLSDLQPSAMSSQFSPELQLASFDSSYGPCETTHTTSFSRFAVSPLVNLSPLTTYQPTTIPTGEPFPTTQTTQTTQSPSSTTANQSYTQAACSHDNLFRLTYWFIKSQSSRVKISVVQENLVHMLTASEQADAAKLIGPEITSYLASFTCFGVSTEGKPLVWIKKGPACNCVDRLLMCCHDDLFREICATIDSRPLPATQLRDHLIKAFKSRGNRELQLRVETLAPKNFQKYMGYLKPYVFFSKMGSRVDRVCYCFSGDFTMTPTNTRVSINGKSTPLIVNFFEPINDMEPQQEATTPQLPMTPQAILQPNYTPTSTVTTGFVSPHFKAPLPPPENICKIGEHSFSLIQDFPHCQQAVQVLHTCSTVAVNCVGVDLSKTSKLCLVQLACSKDSLQHTYVFGIQFNHNNKKI